MQIYTFWAKGTAEHVTPEGQAYHLVAYAGSNLNPADAQTRARQKLDGRLSRLQRGEQLREYPTGTRPLREKLEQRLHNAHGAETGAITRNAYGAQVLNTASVMFVDVDLADLRPVPPTSSDPLTSLLRWLRILPKLPPPPPTPTPLALLETRVHAWLKMHSSWHFRVYRTRAGFRLLATHAEILPTAAAATQVFDALGADRVYARMCQLQACYRARLSPKPWRLGLARPPHAFPYQHESQVREQATWEAEYTARSQAFSVCEFVGDYGSGQVCAAASAVLTLHDATCLGGRKLA